MSSNMEPGYSADSPGESGIFRAMQRVLSLPEIPSHIFIYLEKRELASAALVSRFWSEVALDLLWREIEFVYPLLEILSPIVEADAFSMEDVASELGKIRTLRPADSPQLSIEFPECSGINSLLPNIKEIAWTVAGDITNLPLVRPFISRSLKALTVNPTAGSSVAGVDIVCRFFDTLIAFAGLELEIFRFGRHSLEVKVAAQPLSFLNVQWNIKILEVSSDPYLEPTPVQDILFPNFPQGLHELSANVEFDEQNDYNDRIQTMLQRLPNLRVLELVLTNTGSWYLPNGEALAPFLHNPDLEELTLWVAEEINLNHTDIHTLGRALPKMARLSLRLFYTGLPAVGMPASSLMDFARAFPNLENLYLRITEIDVSLPLPSTDDEVQVCPFNPATFRFLHVGDSLLSQKDVPSMAASAATETRSATTRRGTII